MNHLCAYFLAQLFMLAAMGLGCYLGSEVTVQIGMVALAVIFVAYSIGEAVIVMYPYLDLPEETPAEDEQDGC